MDEKLQVITNQLKSKLELYKTYAKEGWTKTEIIKFTFDVLIDAIQTIQKTFPNLSGKERKELAVDFIKFIYYDKSCLGDPEIPYVPDMVVEKYIFSYVVPDAIDKIVEMFHRYGFCKFENEKTISDIVYTQIDLLSFGQWYSECINHYVDQ